MLPDRVSNPGPLTYESGALPIALRGPASLTSTKPLQYVTIAIITLGCPFNPVNDFEYGRKYLHKLIQVLNSIRLTQRLLIKTPIRS